MRRIKSTSVQFDDTRTVGAMGSEFAGQSTMCALAVSTGFATAGVATAVAVSVAPTWVLGGAMLSGGLAYAGHRAHNNLDLIPSFGKSDDGKSAPFKSDKSDKSSTVVAA